MHDKEVHVMNKFSQIDDPLNAKEKYLYGINLRLEALIDQVSSLVEHIAKQTSASVENVIVEQDVQPAKTRGKRGA